MDENLLEVRDYTGIGYQPLVDYGEWRVAILRYLDDIEPARNKTMERHLQTDEVFVLTMGKGILLLGGNEAQVRGVYPQEMEIGKVYNVKRGAWHTILLSRDASVLIVENCDTGKHNSEYADLSSEHHSLILATAEHGRIQ